MIPIKSMEFIFNKEYTRSFQKQIKMKEFSKSFWSFGFYQNKRRTLNVNVKYNF